MDTALQTYARRLENAFFSRHDAVLLAQRRKLEQMARDRTALSEVSGIRDDHVLNHLLELGIHPELLATLTIVPLAEVAWADGEVQEAERKAILEGAARLGMGRGSVDYVLLEQWLTRRPPRSMLNAWTHYIRGLRKALAPAEMAVIRDELMSRARKVAEAAGGFLGLTARISSEEQAMLDRMADAFNG